MEIKKSKNTQNPKSNKESSTQARAVLSAELVEALVAGCHTEQDLFGPDGVFSKLKGAVMERLLNAEMDHHLGYESYGERPSVNARNGTSTKRVTTESGPVEIRVPRDRDGTFEPKLIPKHVRRLDGFDAKVLALYGRGMTTRDIREHLRELYGTEVSHDLISQITESVLPEFRIWQDRHLESVYPVLYIDAIFVAVRDGAHVKKRPFYVAIGIHTDGRREVLGLWTTENEGAKFWLEILTELKNRGVDDVFFVCADGLAGIGPAIEAVFGKAVYQTCIVHLIRASLRFVSWQHRKAICSDLRDIYTAPTAAAAATALDKLDETWGTQYPAAIRSWRSRWNDFIPFLAYAPEIRKILYTTNVIESVNSQLRKTVRNRGPFPTTDAVFKVFYLGLKNVQTRWKAPPAWTAILAQLDILFADRMPA